MAQVKIRTGTKLFLVYAGERQVKNEDFTIRSTFEKNLNESSFLISVPLQNGKRMEPNEEKKLLIKYAMGGEDIVIEGYVDDVVKQGVRQYWKIRKVTEGRKFFQRQDERIQLALRLDYTRLEWITNTLEEQRTEDGLTLDVSAGGLAMFLNDKLSVGEIINIHMPTVGRTKAGKGFTVRGETCWLRDTEKGNPYRHTMGAKFIFDTTDEKKKMSAYIGAVAKTVG